MSKANEYDLFMGCNTRIVNWEIDGPDNAGVLMGSSDVDKQG